MVLTFDDDGMLPEGDYPMTIQQLRESMLVLGPGDRCPKWDSKWRLRLVNNLEIMVSHLWTFGIDRIFIDGSFVEDKDHPKDIDGYFETTLYDMRTRKLENGLNAIAGFPLWGWAGGLRRPHPDSTKRELPMWHRYRVELWPHYLNAFSGIPDEFGNDQLFPAAFRKSRRSHRPKGIIKLEKS
jgi:hypothetical protein